MTGLIIVLTIYSYMTAHPLNCEDETRAPLKVATLNCGKAGIRKRLADIFSDTKEALQNVDVLFLQECGVKQTILPQDDTSLQSVLGPAFRTGMTGILTHDAGILMLTTKATLTVVHHGPRWAYAHATIRPLGPASAAITALDLWSVHGPVRDFSFWPTTWLEAIRTHTRAGDAIVGADWNATPDPARDSLRGTGGSCPWSTIAPTLTTLNIAAIPTPASGRTLIHSHHSNPRRHHRIRQTDRLHLVLYPTPPLRETHEILLHHIGPPRHFGQL
ncbi:unnamed protein product [Tilletia caries]|nr:unnamed protein product [Tilletia caries]CAD6970346.1 unnamed protein product [Tilletia controversa]